MNTTKDLPKFKVHGINVDRDGNGNVELAMYMPHMSAECSMPLKDAREFALDILRKTVMREIQIHFEDDDLNTWEKLNTICGKLDLIREELGLGEK